MLRVWAASKSAGLLDRHNRRGTAFSYQEDTSPALAVSITMPPRTASWNSDSGLLPIFQMNVPEGEMRERLKRTFAKATGTFDDLDLLGVVGRSQIGRLRYTAPDAELNEEVPFQSVDEILRARRGGDLIEYLLDRFAQNSGISGVQPKVMIRGEHVPKDGKSSVQGATHIVKFWSSEYPELAANEHFCLRAAAHAGLVIVKNELSEDGTALVVERFDRRADGTYIGFEDFCVLNALGTEAKYNGGYETRLFKRITEFFAQQSPAERLAALATAYRIFVLNCMLGNGDAHLKNFGVIYEDAVSPLRLAPVYDIVTTRAYLPKDAMALTLNGSTSWPEKKALVALGQTRCNMRAEEVRKTIEQVADAVADTRPALQAYFNDRSDRKEVGDGILRVWEEGLKRIGGEFGPAAKAEAVPDTSAQ
ncbi:MAG: type II toxin-antitoxin system HipA family toxin [Xanthobacteraceae bacterium]|nr:type II toxin-antitoxin system HipA family toxin [Xanthobacteraceae bacterium]